MRVGPLVLLTLAALVAPSLTHAQVPTPQPAIAHFVHATAGAARVTASPDDVVARLLSFDGDNDGKVQKAELAERMLSVMARGDADNDGALDQKELLALATAPPAQLAVRGFQHGNYLVGGQTEISSRLHMEGALEDLRIEAERKRPALAIVRAFSDTREVAAEAELVDALRPILSQEQLAAMTAALVRQRNSDREPVSGNSRQAVLAMGNLKMVVLRTDLERRLVAFNLPPESRSQAVAAIERYRSQLKLNDAARVELGEQLASVLTSEESGNFLAAIARQPVVAAASSFRVFEKGVAFAIGQKDSAPAPVVRAVPAVLVTRQE